MTSIAEPACFTRSCKHFVGVAQDGETVICRAFPEGIPDAIAYGNDQHLTPQDGDGKIVYERDIDANS